MQRELDTIKFESRRELEDLMSAIDKLVTGHPEEKRNKTLEELYRYIDIMHMEW